MTTYQTDIQIECGGVNVCHYAYTRALSAKEIRAEKKDALIGLDKDRCVIYINGKKARV